MMLERVAKSARTLLLQCVFTGRLRKFFLLLILRIRKLCLREISCFESELVPGSI